RARRPSGDSVAMKAGDLDRRNRRGAAAERERRCTEQGDRKMTHHPRIMRHEIWLGNERDAHRFVMPGRAPHRSSKARVNPETSPGVTMQETGWCDWHRTPTLSAIEDVVVDLRNTRLAPAR